MSRMLDCELKRLRRGDVVLRIKFCMDVGMNDEQILIVNENRENREFEEESFLGVNRIFCEDDGKEGWETDVVEGVRDSCRVEGSS